MEIFYLVFYSSYFSYQSNLSLEEESEAREGYFSDHKPNN